MTTDPRYVRSADALRHAVLDLAAERPVEQIAVTELAKAAGVTRATFYNHATSPQALLSAVLGKELDLVREEFLRSVREHPENVASAWQETGGLLLDHIEGHRDVYRTGLAPAATGDGTVLTELLARHIEGTLTDYSVVRGIPAPADADAATRRAIRASFLSHGIVGAYRAWLTAPHALPREEALRIVLESVPAWWLANIPSQA